MELHPTFVRHEREKFEFSPLKTTLWLGIGDVKEIIQGFITVRRNASRFCPVFKLSQILHLSAYSTSVTSEVLCPFMNRTGAGIYAVRALYLVQTITPPHIFSRRSHTWRSVCSTWAHTRSHSIPADGDRNYGGPATSQWCSSRSVRSPVLGRHAPTAPCLLLKSCRRPAD
ncbi:hypothetical protein DFH06DRAFT_442548 [Mycena polygramma]|nr:hypothetical protein DFH06DRAFT_442548 [Mycena polygramma]